VQDLAQTPNTLAQSSINFTYRSADGFEDGNADGWEPYNDNGNTVRWSVVEDEGDMAYYLNTTKFDNLSGNRLGESFTAQAKLGDDVTVNSLADYAVVFGFEDSENCLITEQMPPSCSRSLTAAAPRCRQMTLTG